MRQEYKNVLYIHLDTQEYEFKIHEDLWAYVGGVAVSYKLLKDNFDTASFVVATGPLSGIFPYVSKANVSFISEGNVVEKYGGGTLASKLNLAGIDAVVFTGDTTKNLHIGIFQKDVTIISENEEAFDDRHSDVLISRDSMMSKKYFSFGNFSEINLPVSGKISINVDTTESHDFEDFYHYEELYSQALDDYKNVTVEPRNNPSCFGCPMGCDVSHEGEDDQNIAVLPRSLISCGYSEDIYKNIPFVYACLSSVGYTYQHSQLEELPELFGALKMSLQQDLDL